MRSAPSARKSVGILPTHCVASVWNRTPASRHMRAAAGASSSAPVSLLAHISDTSAISPARALSIDSSAPRSAAPSACGSQCTAQSPRDSSSVTHSRTALCSSRVVTTSGCTAGAPAAADRAVHASIDPRIAWLQDSVPPEVKTTSRGVQPTSEATDSRASSTACRAAMPTWWMLEGLPHPLRMASTIASITAGDGAVVALWSRSMSSIGR